jgi:hypothetical protein
MEEPNVTAAIDPRLVLSRDMLRPLGIHHITLNAGGTSPIRHPLYSSFVVPVLRDMMTRTGNKSVSGNYVYHQLASILNAAMFRPHNLFLGCVSLRIINILKNSGNYKYHFF